MASVKLYPYAHFSAEGKFMYIGANTYRYGVEETKAGGEVSKESGTITVYLPAMEIEVSEPAMAELEGKAVELLRHSRDKIRASHHMLMTKMQMAENNLLRLGAPEVIERVENERQPSPLEDVEDVTPRRPGESGDPDMPF